MMMMMVVMMISRLYAAYEYLPIYKSVQGDLQRNVWGDLTLLLAMTVVLRIPWLRKFYPPPR
jgi:hypothetical protein